jgi:hypothetical protein
VSVQVWREALILFNACYVNEFVACLLGVKQTSPTDKGYVPTSWLCVCKQVNPIYAKNDWTKSLINWWWAIPLTNWINSLVYRPNTCTTNQLVWDFSCQSWWVWNFSCQSWCYTHYVTYRYMYMYLCGMVSQFIILLLYFLGRHV